MESDYETFEIAIVIRDFWLIDSDSYQRKYCTRHGKPIAPGYYVVNWPEHIRARRFDEHAEFHGPFASRQEAQIKCKLMTKDNAPYNNRYEYMAKIASAKRVS